MLTAADLNQRFARPGEVEFKVADHGALVAQVANAAGSGAIACQGAQVLTWAPAGQAPVVWLSPDARFQATKSLRGGIPVCWPWFGAHAEDPSMPAHGFARNLDWDIRETATTPEGTRVLMGFTPGEAQRALWPHSAELTLAVTMGKTLRLILTTRNKGAEPIAITQALHTYFHVGDIGAVRVEGLEGCDYIDKATRGDPRIQQEGPIAVDREVNRIYLGCPGPVAIVDEALRRRILIDKSGSGSYVVWNPWAETGAKFGDMGPDGYRKMLCVETTNAWTDTAAIAPGAEYALTSEYRVERL
jgi:glucose-6-phosphate 1-epimerase